MADDLDQPTGWTPAAQEKVVPYLDEIFEVLGALGHTERLGDLVAVVWDPLTIQVRVHGNLPAALGDTIRRASEDGIGVEHVHLVGDPEQVEAAMLRLAGALNAHHVDWSSLAPDAMYTKLTVGIPEAALTAAAAQRIRRIAAGTIVDDLAIDLAIDIDIVPDERDVMP